MIKLIISKENYVIYEKYDIIYIRLYNFVGVILMMIFLALFTLIIDVLLIIDGTKHKSKWERNLGIILFGVIVFSNVLDFIGF